MARTDGLVQTLQGVLGTEEEGLFGLNRYTNTSQLSDTEKLDAILEGQNKKSSGFATAPDARSRFSKLSGVSIDNRMDPATKYRALGFEMTEVRNAAQILRNSADFNPFVAQMLAPLIPRKKGRNIKLAGSGIALPKVPKIDESKDKKTTS